MENNGIFKALDLAKYINGLYKEKYNNRDISPLKLQKTLFFLFGEWGGFIAKNSSGQTEGEFLNEYSKYLFDEEIEAWVYGPVVKKVYDNFNNEEMTYEEIFNTEEKQYVGEFINDLASELFELSDFKLVELTHQTLVWNKYFDKKEIFHNNVMDKDEIIQEFI